MQGPWFLDSLLDWFLAWLFDWFLDWFLVPTLRAYISATDHVTFSFSFFSKFEAPYLGNEPADLRSDDTFEVHGGRTDFREGKKCFFFNHFFSTLRPVSGQRSSRPRVRQHLWGPGRSYDFLGNFIFYGHLFFQLWGPVRIWAKERQASVPMTFLRSWDVIRFFWGKNLFFWPAALTISQAAVCIWPTRGPISIPQFGPLTSRGAL